MFFPLKVQAATTLSLNLITVFEAQNVGVAIGNMICPNNVVAVATTVEVLGEEGILIRKIFPVFMTFLSLHGIIVLI